MNCSEWSCEDQPTERAPSDDESNKADESEHADRGERVAVSEYALPRRIHDDHSEVLVHLSERRPDENHEQAGDRCCGGRNHHGPDLIVDS